MSETPASSGGADSGALHNLPVYSVSEISFAVKRTLESEFAHVRVRGEISGYKRHSSGHTYFALKDEEAVLDAVAWRGTLPRLAFAVEDGLEVICTGRVSSYPGRSKYQIIVESIEIAGQGALLKLLAERRKKLEAEGLFAAERKKPIPFLPDVIGVITSPTGAVIRDILHRLNDRFPRHVLLWPVAVQGEGAAEQVAAAIEGFNAIEPGGLVPRPDLLIVARGGGSLEDLWAFNEEIVVRAAAASKIPLIAAIGHETDVTLIDFAADLRAPTPTAAAEMAVPVRTELLAQTLDYGRRIYGGMTRLIAERRNRVEGLRRGLPDPDQLLAIARQRLDDRAERLNNAVVNFIARLSDRGAKLAARLRHPKVLIERKTADLRSETRALASVMQRLVAESQMRFRHLAALLESFSYERILDRGFALVRDAAGTPVTAAASLSAGDDIGITFHDGDVGAKVTGAAPPAKKAKTGTAAPAQPKKPRDEKPRDEKSKDKKPKDKKPKDKKPKDKKPKDKKPKDKRQGELL